MLCLTKYKSQIMKEPNRKIEHKNSVMKYILISNYKIDLIWWESKEVIVQKIKS